MTHPLAAAVAIAALLAAVAGHGVAATPGAAGDVRLLGTRLQELHPQPYRAMPKPRFRAAVATTAARAPRLGEDQLLVELMRVAALVGPRNGHTGIFPADPAHRRELHLYPLRLYAFSDGVHVVDAKGAPELVGARLVGVGGRSLEEVAALVRPLVPRDNDSNLRGLWPHFLLTAEVLHGLGVADDVGPLAFELRLRDGTTVERALEPLAASDYVSAFPDAFVGHYPAVLPAAPRPLWLANASRDVWLTRLGGGRIVYLGYNSARASVYDVSQRLVRLARRKDVERIVVDVRRNPGGDNTTFGALVGVLSSPAVNRPGRLYLLVGRATFSAAGNFAAEVEAATGAIVVGEPTGGGLDIYADTSPVLLPASGLNVNIARVRHVRGRPGDGRLAVTPDVTVAISSADWLAGRDPVLAAVLAAR